MLITLYRYLLMSEFTEKNDLPFDEEFSFTDWTQVRSKVGRAIKTKSRKITYIHEEIKQIEIKEDRFGENK